MISNLIKRNMPEWIEAGTILATILISAILAAGVTYYKVDVMTKDVAYIKKRLDVLPEVVAKVNYTSDDIKRIQSQIDYLYRRHFDGEKRTEKGLSFRQKQTTAGI